MKKHLVFLLSFLLILSSTACTPSVQNTSNLSVPPTSNNSNRLTPEDLGLQPTNTTYTKDFDPSTNQTVTFGSIMFQIPQRWIVVETTDVTLQINGTHPSMLGSMWIELLDTNMTEADLATANCQQAILDSYIEMMDESFDNVIVTNSSYYTQEQLFFAYIKGSVYDTYGECGVCAFVEQGNLYAYLVPFMEGDEYNYCLDVQEVVRTVAPVSSVIDKEAPTASDANTPDTSYISVRYEPNYTDGNRSHLTVFTKNNSDQTFSGDIQVTFYSNDGNTFLGEDTILITELSPGCESWANIIIDTYYAPPKMAVKYSNVLFSPVREITDEIDAYATEKTKNDYYWNFNSVSWYNDVSNIVVYTDGTCIATITQTAEEEGQFYAAVIWSCGKGYGVKTIRIIDSNGTVLAVY